MAPRASTSLATNTAVNERRLEQRGHGRETALRHEGSFRHEPASNSMPASVSASL